MKYIYLVLSLLGGSLINYAPMMAASAAAPSEPVDDEPVAKATRASAAGITFVELPAGVSYNYKKIRGYTFANHILNEWTFSNTELLNVKFVNCTHNEVTFGFKTELINSSFEDCTFKGGRFSNASLGNVTFDNCIFDNVDFGNAELTDVTFNNCIFIDVSWKQSTLNIVKFNNVALDGSFSLAECFVGATLNRTDPYTIKVPERLQAPARTGGRAGTSAGQATTRGLSISMVNGRPCLNGWQIPYPYSARTFTTADGIEVVVHGDGSITARRDGSVVSTGTLRF